MPQMPLRTEAATEEGQGRQRQSVFRLWLLQRGIRMRLQGDKIRELEQTGSKDLKIKNLTI